MSVNLKSRKTQDREAEALMYSGEIDLFEQMQSAQHTDLISNSLWLEHQLHGGIHGRSVN